MILISLGCIWRNKMSEAEYLDSIYPYTEEYYKELSELHLKSLQKHLKENV